MLAPVDLGHFSIVWTFAVTDTLRTVGLAALLTYFYSYQKYHRICVEARQSEMVAASLAESMRGSFSHRSWRDAVDCIWIPVVAPLYGS